MISFCWLKACVLGMGFCVMAAAEAFGISQAVIVVGLTTSETHAARLREQAGSIRDGLVRRGVAPEAVTVLGAQPGEGVRREAILKTLAPSSRQTDETWVVLLGTVAETRGGMAAFQVSGPRLTAKDLAESLAALPGRKLVVVCAAGGGGLLPPLVGLPDVEAVAATASSGELNEPRFSGFWAEVLRENSDGTFQEMAVEASKRVTAYYAENKLALPEHAWLIDPESRRVVEAPFAAGAVSPEPGARKDAGSSPGKGASAVADIVVPKSMSGLDRERRPATPESRSLIAAAKALGDDSGHSAIVLSQNVEITVARNFSSSERWRKRTWVRTGEAIDAVATLVMPVEPPFLETTLQGARVILPDGEQWVINPRTVASQANARRNEQTGPGGRDPRGTRMVELPGVVTGSLVEVEWTVERRSSHDIPAFCSEWVLPGRFPMEVCRVRLTYPKDEAWHFFAHGFPSSTAESETAGLRSVEWELRAVPAREQAAGDLPVRATLPWLGLSSFPTWQSVADWYQRLTTGSDEVGTSVNELAQQIGREHAGRQARLRAAFEAVTAVRYVAIELGVGGWRPRTPEQVWNQRYGDCKDKANLLVAVLRLLGIEAELVLLNRTDVTFAEFAGWQFNHAIARVPASPAEGQDHDLWLDATDRLVPFGVIAPGDLGRQALILPRQQPSRLVTITGEQEPPSELREIWKLSPDSACISYSGTVTLSATGAADAMLRHMFAELTPSERTLRLSEWIGMPTVTVDSMGSCDAYDLAKPFVVKASVRVPAPEAVPARPPEFWRVFRVPNRSASFQVFEGRPTRYLQEITWSGGSGPYLPDSRREAAGFVFTRERRAGGLRREVVTPAGTVAPQAYGELRQAWIEFGSTPPSQRTQ